MKPQAKCWRGAGGWGGGGCCPQQDMHWLGKALSPEHSKMVQVTHSEKTTRFQLLVLAGASTNYLGSRYWLGPLDPGLLAYKFHWIKKKKKSVGLLVGEEMSWGRMRKCPYSKRAQPGLQMKRQGEGVVGGALPSCPELAQQDVAHGLIFEVVVDCPVDTQLSWLPDEPQDRPEAFSYVKVFCSTALFPCVDCEQLQSIHRQLE